MGRNFWPLFTIVAALGAAAVWTQTPRYVTMLPDGLRRAFRAYVRQAQGLGTTLREKGSFPKQVDEVDPVSDGTVASTPPPAPQQTPPPTPQPPGAASVPKIQPAATRPAETARTPAAPAAHRFASPADAKGVHPVNVPSADWCVLMRNTPISALDEKPLGNAPGGRFFLIERRARTVNGQGTTLIGNFTPKRLSQPVQINSLNVLCLSGSPDDLTTAQLHALKMYYQLRGEALEYLDEVRRTKGDSASPFYRKLAEAERIRDFRAKELAQMKTLRGDQRAVEMEELEKLKRKAADIRAQHEGWKRANSAQISDPTRDPHYQELVREYRRYAGGLPPGLAKE